MSKVCRPRPAAIHPLLTSCLLLGSVEDFASLQAAFDGVYGVFVNTDTFTIGEQREIYANMRIFEIAKQTKTLRHYVFSGLGYALKLGGYNPEYMVDHFNGKGRFADWLKAQPSVVDDTALSWSVVNTCLYMEMLNHVCHSNSLSLLYMPDLTAAGYLVLPRTAEQESRRHLRLPFSSPRRPCRPDFTA